MAIQHIQFNDTFQHGRLLRAGLNQIEEGIDRLVKLRGTMTLMVDGDGSNAEQFGEVTSRFGFDGNDNAKSALDEINSLLGKLTTDDSVSFVRAALAQAFSKFR